MSATLVLVLALSVVVGLSLGLLGGGGSILTVPILVYVAGLDAKEAIATSLFVVGVTSAAGALNHARAGRVRWRTGLVFGIAGMAGAFTGGILGGYVPGGVLLVGFALMMLAASVAMIRGRRTPPAATRADLPVLRVLVHGAAVGLVAGLVGAGGGFLVVPALALLGGLSMPVAVGTSLVVIAMQSLAGLAGYLSTVPVDWALAAGVTAAAVVGSLVGGRLAGRVPEAALRTAFGWFVLAMGTFVLLEQAPEGVLLPALGVVGALALLAAATAGVRRAKRSSSRPDRMTSDEAAVGRPATRSS